MATSQTKTHPFTTGYEHFAGAGEQVLAAARKAGEMYLDSYEKAVDRMLELEHDFAKGTQQEWLKGLIETHVDVSRELTSSYTSAARGVLR